MRYTARVKGGEKLQKYLKKQRNENNLKKIVMKNGLEAQLYSVQIAPVDTGNLKRMIRFYSEDGGYQARWTSEAEYALDQEKGTRAQSGTPHIKPSFDKQKVKFIREVRREIRE